MNVNNPASGVMKYTELSGALNQLCTASWADFDVSSVAPGAISVDILVQALQASEIVSVRTKGSAISRSIILSSSPDKECVICQVKPNAAGIIQIMAQDANMGRCYVVGYWSFA